MKTIKAFHQGTSDLLNTKKVEIVNLSTYENIATVLCIERQNKKNTHGMSYFSSIFSKETFFYVRNTMS